MLYMGDNLNIDDGVNPQVWLHDCLFSIRAEEDALVFEFPEGFKFKQGGACYRSARGMIRAAGCDADGLNIMAFRTKWKHGRYQKRGVSLSIEELIELLDGGCLENYNEYYSPRDFLWRCSPRFLKKSPKQLGSEVEIEAFFERLEYYRSEEYEPYEC